MKPEYIIILSVVFGVLSLFMILALIFQRVRNTLEAIIRENFDPKEMIAATTRANFFGVKSFGSRQIRGNGALVLTKKHLVFIRALPSREYEILLSSVKKVSLPDAFNGKSVFSNLLCVHYEINGTSESMAWAVKNPSKWKQAIEQLIRGG